VREQKKDRTIERGWKHQKKERKKGKMKNIVKDKIKNERDS
jgi:hypothetical protein